VSGDLSGAIDDARQILSLLQTLQDRWGTARASLTLGSALNQSGDLEAAAASYRNALAIFSAVHDRQRVAITMSNLAIVTPDDAAQSVTSRTETRQQRPRYSVAERLSPPGWPG
jgi:hypothetical protein